MNALAHCGHYTSTKYECQINKYMIERKSKGMIIGIKVLKRLK